MIDNIYIYLHLHRSHLQSLPPRCPSGALRRLALDGHFDAFLHEPPRELLVLLHQLQLLAKIEIQRIEMG